MGLELYSSQTVHQEETDTCLDALTTSCASLELGCVHRNSWEPTGVCRAHPTPNVAVGSLR